MAVFKAALAAAVVIVAAGAVAASYSYRRGMNEAEEAWQTIAARPRQPARPYDPALVADLPEIARRYFAHAIAPGTLLHQAVELEMRGTFLLGDHERFQTYGMTARQILAPPTEFVWMPRMSSGAMRISGSDALVGGNAWTRFWVNGLVPVANERALEGLRRSSEFRSAMEGIWVPASLLPENGAVWQQIGPDRARVTIGRARPPIVIELTLDSDGSVIEAVGQRWSNANAGKTFRLQPFGGTIAAEATFGGYTIPSALSVGNHFGTDDYLPFFQAEIVSSRYL